MGTKVRFNKSSPWYFTKASLNNTDRGGWFQKNSYQWYPTCSDL